MFVNDIPKFQHELYAAFTLADVASATIESIDASEALVSWIGFFFKILLLQSLFGFFKCLN